MTQLVGFAELPAETFAVGPPAGAAVDANGFTGPFIAQPVQGFSGVQFAPGSDAENDDTFLFLSDNGFGAQGNSADYLLRLYEATPDFETGEVILDTNDEGLVTSFIQLSDPNNLIPFDIVNEGTEDRLLTGADFDIESFVIAENGDLIIGEEFGPFLLRFNSEGELIEAPIATPNITDVEGAAPFVLAPQNPEVLSGTAEANIGGSNGFEGLAFSPDRSTAFPLLEGAVDGDPEDALRIYEFDLETSEFADELVGFYQLEDPEFAIGDFTPINETEYLVIERDQLQGPEAAFKQIFKVDLSEVDEDGFVSKELVVDLLDIDDPDDLNGDGETTFTFPFVTIEDVLVLDENTILVANDNNFPFSIGRDFSGVEIDNNEIILLELDEPLDLDPNIPFLLPAIVGTEEDDLLFGTPEAESIDGLGGDDIIIAGDGDDTLEGGAGDDFLDAEAGDDLIDGGVGNDIIVAGAGDDTIVASEGIDIIIGDDGTSDLDDIDTVDFSGTGAGVVGDLALGTATTGIEFIGEVLVPTGTIFTDDTLGDTVIGGLSGLEFDPATGSYFAIADDQVQPQRFYTLDLILEDGTFTGVEFADAVQLLDSDGEPFTDFAVDPESIRIAPDAASLFFTGETGGGPEDIDDDIPFVAEIGFDGTPIAGPFTFEGFGFDDGGTPDDDSDDTGVRNNLAFESLTFAPDGTAFTATENALFQDGPAASLEAGSPSRVVQFDPETGESLTQFVYVTEPIPDAPIPADSFATNGLVEILAVSETQLLFLERAFSVGVGNTVQVFLGNISEATDVSDLTAVEGEEFVPVEKTFLFDTASFGITPDNLEGITFGPTLEDGSQSFFIVSDNNFNDAQVTQFLGFSLDGSVADIEVDVLTDIENLSGSEFDDFLTGDDSDNVLTGNGGDDGLNGGAGNDTLDGGEGSDTAIFSDAAVAADLSLDIATTGIDFIGEVLIPTGTIFTDDTLGDTEIGGLSGLEFDPATGSFFALSDSQVVPQRFYTLDLVIEEGALTDAIFLDAVQLLDSDGEPFADFAVDPESIRIAPDAASLFFTGETGGGPEDIDDDIPFVAEIGFDGTPIAGPFTFEGFGFDDGGTPDDDSDDTGVRNNLAFESLTFAPDGTAFTATENALFQDGPTASLTESSPSRVIQFDPETGESLAQFIYEVDPIPVAPDPVDSFADNGLVEMLAISETEFLFVERSFAVGIGNTIRVFLGDISEATDVSDLDSIADADVTVIDKSLLFDTASFGIDPDNIEGITFGPTLEDGRQSFFLVSDNNFNGPQVTQFLGFALDSSIADAEVDVLTDIENLTGSGFDDFLTGDESDNVLIGNGGDDFLNGAGGADSLEGGAGDDTFVSDALDTIDGGADGSDTVDFSGLDAGIVIDLDVESAGALGTPGQNGGILAGPPAIDADGVESADNILQDVDDVENIIGTDFNDLLIGNNESNEIQAGDGDDTLAGVAADDILDGGDGIDTALFTFAPAPIIVDLAIAGPQLIGPPGTDTLISIENVSGSDFASDTLLGNEEANVLSSLAFDDVLDGRAGDDTLNGGDGDDTLTGGEGSNTLDGGEGTDTATFAGVQADFEIEVAEDETVSVSNPAAGIDDVLTSVEVLSFDDGDVEVADLIEDAPVIGTPGADVILGGIDIDAVDDLILTGAGDDEILLSFAGAAAGGNAVVAGSGNDTIFTSNDDTVVGGSGDDTFFLGGAGSTLFGGSGDDTFFFDEGEDNVIFGGSGADVFTLSPGEVPAVANAITGFSIAEDAFAGVGFEDVTFDGSDVLVDGNTVATLLGIDAAALTEANFV